MKTGEILITIHKQDIKYLVKDLLGLPTDKLSPFSATIELNQAAVAPAETLQSLAQNADVVKCLTALSAPT
ncbi:MAG: hypothetical protein WCL06_10685, partial [Bacteroidota bacterium]